jgi:O-antigen/teichoic acid export membrane protein
MPRQCFDLKPLFHFGKNSWLTSLVEFGLGKQIDIILIGYFIAAKSEVGFYNLAISTVIILSGLTTAGLGGVALSAFSEIEKKWGLNKLKVAWESMIKLEYLLSVPLIAFLGVYAHQIIKAIYTETFLPAVPMIQLYASFFILQRIFGGGIHITAFYAMKKSKIILIARFIGGLLNLVFNLILIPLYGGIGAIIATGISVLVTVIIEYLFAAKYISKTYPYQFILKISISITVALCILSLIKVESFISIIYAGLIYGLLLSFMFYIFKPLDKNDQKIIFQMNLTSFKYLKLFCS